MVETRNTASKRGYNTRDSGKGYQNKNSGRGFQSRAPTGGRGRGRDNSRYSRSSNYSTNKNNTRTTGFRGANDNLQGKIFDYGAMHHRDQYPKTVETIVTYIGQHFDAPKLVMKSLETQTLCIPDPLKSKRFEISLLAWSSALRTSTMSASQTTSNDGIVVSSGRGQ